jgi:hypothetical protein
VLRLALIVYVGYLLAAALFLNSPLADRAINRFPERFEVQWRAAVSPWPGVVLAQDVVTKGHVRNTQWRAEANYASGRIALLPLLWRELRLPTLRAHDLAVSVDRVDTQMPPRQPSAEAWTLSLPRIHSSSVRELRWNALRAVGLGQATLAMTKQLRGGPLEIHPSTLALRDARLSFADTDLLSAARIGLELAMERHVPARHPGRCKLALLTLALQVDAKTDALDLTRQAGQPTQVQRQPAAGTLLLDLALQRGELQPGGTLELRLPLSIAVDGGVRRNNVLSVQAGVDQQVVLLATFPAAADGDARLDAQLQIDQRTLPLDGWGSLLQNTSGQVSLRWRFDSLRWLSELLVRKRWFDFNGAGVLDADLQLARGELAPGSRFELPEVQLEAQVLNDTISGSGRATGRIEPATAADAAPQVRVHMQLGRFAMAPRAAPEQIYVEGSDLTLDLDSSGDLRHFRETLLARVRFTDARVPDLTHYNLYLPKRDLSFTGGSGTLSGDLTLDARGRVERGELDVRGSQAQMRIAALSMAGDVRIQTRLAASDLTRRRLQLDGTRIDLSRVAFQDAAGNARGDWWAQIHLPQAQASWGRPMRVDAEARMEMKDVSLLLALFTQKKPFPKWVARLVDAGQTQVQTDLQLRGTSLVLDRLQAENRRFKARARLRLADAKASGDLLLRWGVLALGVELDQTERDYRLIGATDWYESRPDLLPLRLVRGAPAD